MTDGTPSYEAEEQEITRDARRERRLVWQGLLAAGVVAVVIVARELFLQWL